MSRAPNASVGGQAVIEGVMMRAPSAWAVAVRRPDGTIEAVTHELPRLSSRSRLARIPFIRGVMVLGESLTLRFEHYVEPTFAFSAIEHPEFSYPLAGICVLLAVTGIGLAWLYYAKDRGPHGLTERSAVAAWGYKVLVNKYYIDWLYEKVDTVWTDVVTGGVPVGPERRRLARRPRLLVGWQFARQNRNKDDVIDAQDHF